MFEITEEFLKAVEKKKGSPIKRLNLGNNGLKSIGKLPLIKDSLIQLNLEENNFRNLDGFEAFEQLIKLILTENRITNIDSLKSLQKLEILDLRGNRINSINQLQVLKHLNQLREIKLEGNPTVGTVEYPIEVFRLQSNLQKVDTWERQQVEEMLSESLSPQQPQPQPVAQQPAGESKAVAQSQLIQYQPNKPDNSAERIVSLEQQLQAMHEAFALQEHALLPSAKHATTFCLTPQHAPENVKEEIVEHFPYMKLLSTWRKQAYTAILQNTLTQEKIKTLYSDMLKQRKKTRLELQNLEFSELKYKTQNSALESRNVQLTNQLSELTEKLQNCEFEVSRLNEEKMKETFSFQNLSKFLHLLQSEIQHRELQQETLFSSLKNRLLTYENRIQQLVEEVEVVQEMIAVKELNLRNSTAVLAAKTRLLATHNIPTTVTADGETAATATTAAVAQPQTYKLSEVRVSVEGESLLKAIFHSLDNNEEGLISNQTLYRALYEESDQDDEEQQQLTLSELGQVVCRALGSSLFTIFTANLSSSLSLTTADSNSSSVCSSEGDGKLCWGEVLLLLIPNPTAAPHHHHEQQQQGTGLTRQEIRSLSQEQLLDTWENGVIPLHLPHHTQPHTHAEPTMAAAGDEVKRLRSERKVLLQKLQLTSRHMTRNCEEIKSYFTSQIRLLSLQNSRLSTDYHELQSQLIQSQHRYHECETVLQHTREKLESQIQVLEVENDDLKHHLNTRKTQDMLTLEQALHSEQEKYQRLEQEKHLLQRAFNDGNLKLKRQERDNLKLEALKKQHEEQIAALQAQNQALIENQRNVEASLRKDSLQRELEWETEKKDLLARLNEMQAELLESQEHRIKLEAERAHQQQQQAQEEEKQQLQEEHQAKLLQHQPQPLHQQPLLERRATLLDLQSSLLPSTIAGSTETAAAVGGGGVRPLNRDQQIFAVAALIREAEELLAKKSYA